MARERGVSGSRRAVGAAAALALLAAGLAQAQGPSRQAATTVFDEGRPAHSTGARLAIDYVNPTAAGDKPPAVEKVVTRLHPGTVIDTSVPARCTASDVRLMTAGAAACPPGSRVGGGQVDLDTGLPGPPRVLENDVTLLNGEDELIFLLESKGGPTTRFVSRAAIDGATITSEVPPVPGGPPDGFTAIKRVRLAVQAVTAGSGRSRRALIATPPSCPRSGSWTNTATFTYRDGVSQTVASRSPCRRPAARDRTAPRIALAGVPRRCCAPRTFTARVRIADAGSGLRRAAVWLDGRRLLTTAKARFSRRISTRNLRPASHRLTVVAVDRAGNRAVRTVRFTSCGGPR